MKSTILVLLILLTAPVTFGQRSEITISLNEQFFDSLLDAIYQNAEPPEIPISQMKEKESGRKGGEETASFSYQQKLLSNAFIGQSASIQTPVCGDSIKLLRELNGTRTAVRFRDGKIYAPIAFLGSYAPPFVGCVDFSGVAETNIDLEFDRDKQILVGRARVLSVNLNGTGGLGGSVIAKMVQSSIDKKINPVNIVDLEKVSFVIPIQNSARIKMKAVNMRPEVNTGAVTIHITYEFLKA